MSDGQKVWWVRDKDGLPVPVVQKFQYYWRCAHHPSAIENFFSTRQTCEWGCHTTELRWYHSGESPMPKSWAEPRGTALADKVFGDRFEPYLATQTRFGKGPC